MIQFDKYFSDGLKAPTSLQYYLYHLLKVSVLQKKSPGITKDPVMMFFMNVESSKI